MVGGTSGTQTMKGVAIHLAGANTNTGIDITVPNDGTHFVARSPDNLLDQFKISVGAAGATTLSTNDNDAAVANLTLDADGKIIIEAAAGDEVVFNEGSADVDFRVETADESHMLFIEGSSNRMSVGDNTGSPGATLEIKNHASAGATGVPLLQLNNNDTDQQCLDINAGNIDANVVNITANDVTTARVLSIGADGLTTGNALYVDDNSSNTGTRNSALIIQNHASATGSTALTVQSDGGITGVKLDKNYSDTNLDATVTGLQIDFDKTGASTTDNTMYGLNIDMDNVTATNGTNYMYGLHVTPTLSHSAGTGGSYVYGAHIDAQGGTNGSSLVQAAFFKASGGTFNSGIIIDCENGDSNIDFRIRSSADNTDHFTIRVDAAGETTFTTVDTTVGATAHLTCSVDGDIVLEPVGGNVRLIGSFSGSAGLEVGSHITGSGGFRLEGDATVSGGITVRGPLIADMAAVHNFTGDDGNATIPITAATAQIDANGSARTGMRFAGGGVAGQILVVINAGGENVAFANGDGTALLRGTNVNKDTIRPSEAHVFVSDGTYWNHIGGGTTDEGGGLTAG